MDIALIVFAKVAGVPLWLAGNAVLQQLTVDFDLPASTLVSLSLAVQQGFIVGTLVFALITIAD